MTEDYLHFIWKNKRIPGPEVKLIDGRTITVRKFGIHNDNLKGPDFTLGSIQMDELTMYGQIEMHVKSSDWFRHKHHLDSNYDNVILHVVYQHDADVFQNGLNLPTLEMKSHIDREHFKKFTTRKIKQNNFPCENLLETIDDSYIESMKIRALSDKLNEKIADFTSIKYPDLVGVFYHLVGLAFGTSINKDAFKILVDKIPFSAIIKLSATHRFNLLVSESGIMQESEKIVNMELPQWHFKGTRPSNFPTLRVNQFAFIASRYNFDTSFTRLEPQEIIDTFKNSVHEIWQDTYSKVSQLTDGFTNHLLINAVAPFLWCCSEVQEDVRLKNKVLEMLQLIPEEKNGIIKKWNKIGIFAQNALDSQSLLALNRYYCAHKKCLSCGVGNKVLNQ